MVCTIFSCHQILNRIECIKSKQVIILAWIIWIHDRNCRIQFYRLLERTIVSVFFICNSVREVSEKFEETIKMNAAHADAHFQLGMALLNEGKLTEAVNEFETYVKLAPDGQYATQAKGMIAQLKK